MGEVYSLRLVAQKRQQGQGYDACWVHEGGQTSKSFPLELPLTEEDAAELRWYLERFRGFLGPGTRVQVRQVEERIEALGRKLFEVCFGGNEDQEVYRNLLNAAKAGRQVLLTLGSNESSFLQQPWELMRDEGGPLVFQNVSLRRQLVGAKPAPARPMAFCLPLRLLLIVARPNGVGFLDPRSSMAPLLDALELLPAGAVELAFCQPPTLARLEELISAAKREKKPFHIVHFDGHGGFDPATGVGVLAFEQADLSVDRVTGQRLGDLLVSHEIPLMILEACRTSDLSDAPVFGSLAPALLESGVGSVVAFSHSVHMDASRILVEHFYRELVAGRTVGQALAGARAALMENRQRRRHFGRQASTFERQDWFIPQLYQVGADPALLVTKEEKSGEAAAPPRPEERMHGFPPKPMYRFHGRASDLLEIERAFERHRAVLVAGGGGMGKTALAREAAFWWLRTGRFEKAVFVSFERPTTVERVVQELGRAWEGTSFSSRSREEQHRVALEIFQEKKVLLVWDNFESTLPQFQQGEADGPVAYPEEGRSRLRSFYEELRESGGEGRLLVTCRPADAALQGIKQRSLWGLDRVDSMQLLHAIADVRGIDLERDGFIEEEIDKLLDLLGDHPLSLSLVVPHLRSLKPVEIRDDFENLLDRFQDDSADEERNRSLLASLRFSTSRLSKAAQEVLPYLAWFHGGAFETYILAFTRIPPNIWSQIRSELEATALVRTESLDLFKVPFLRFHPTLSSAVHRQEVADEDTAEKRYVAVYSAVKREADTVLQGSDAAAGMSLMEREEVNFRSAIEVAFRRGQRRSGMDLAYTLGVYLQMTARLQEQNFLMDQVRTQVREGEPLDGATCDAIRQQSFSLVNGGQAGESVIQLNQLIARIQVEGLAGGEDPAFQLGTSYSYLAEAFVHLRRPDLALAPSVEAIRILENLPSEAASSNLAAAFGDLANTYRMLGHLSEALAVAERGLAVNRQLNRERNLAVGLDQVADILGQLQEWTEAEKRNAEALDLARKIGDIGLQAIFLQHLGGLHTERGNPARAAEIYEQALVLFQQAGDVRGEMGSCHLLASAERDRGRLDVAEAWYARTYEMARQLENQAHLGALAQNLGILYQKRALGARDAAVRASWLRRALASIEESLAIKFERNDQIGMASSYSQLGILFRLLGDYANSESNSLRALRIHESLDHPNAINNFDNLADLATERGDTAAAASWAAKSDAKLAELERLRGGGGSAIK